MAYAKRLLIGLLSIALLLSASIFASNSAFGGSQVTAPTTDGQNATAILEEEVEEPGQLQ
jgi:hypothetical protein